MECRPAHRDRRCALSAKGAAYHDGLGAAAFTVIDRPEQARVGQLAEPLGPCDRRGANPLGAWGAAIGLPEFRPRCVLRASGRADEYGEDQQVAHR